MMNAVESTPPKTRAAFVDAGMIMSLITVEVKRTATLDKTMLSFDSLAAVTARSDEEVHYSNITASIIRI